MYKQILDEKTKKVIGICRIRDNAGIPLALDNTDYVTFKKEVLEGAELQDADGNLMANAAEFVRGLP